MATANSSENLSSSTDAEPRPNWKGLIQVHEYALRFSTQATEHTIPQQAQYQNILFLIGLLALALAGGYSNE
jgi:hypothetical protein